jgi:hypothetical protein
MAIRFFIVGDTVLGRGYGSSFLICFSSSKSFSPGKGLLFFESNL